ncbi:hypothetical protein Caci_2802 [Catenulispora acidiphila DSM 44928]|uniref:Uncharacterized protein n=1 Tax=Catenulispora acidiphila (strain DSM 44928 / JCM 14897 / NBRC 102108 / NRRL B-24433 / ID139908) TaxID=479433 RepID=C7Q140_CATAD|nr:hypothetical protein [Catenulispora acidiphila]ACU71715.1 hypothetical protein Caci_2802 [Catenulispora acidiphila DSM 44928]
MNETGATYTEAELHTGLTAYAAEEDFDPLLTGMADRAMMRGRRLVRRHHAAVAAASLAVLGLAASAAIYLRPGHGSPQPPIPPAVGIDTAGATALLAYNATCFDGPVAQPSMTTFVWNPASKQYVKSSAAPMMELSPDGKLVLLQTGITLDGTTSYAVAPWADVAAGHVPAVAYRRFSSQVSLKWAADGRSLIDAAAGHADSASGADSISFYDPISFAKTSVPLPQSVRDLIDPKHTGGAWRVIDVSGTTASFTVTVMSKNAKQMRVIDGSGKTVRNVRLSNVPGHLGENDLTSATLSPDGRYLALWGNPGLAVYDLATSADRLIFHAEHGAAGVDGKPHSQDFDFTGWTAHDQLLGIVRWSTSNQQQRDVHQQIKLLTPYGDQVGSQDIAVPGDAQRVCSVYITTTGPATDYPSATKL